MPPELTVAVVALVLVLAALAFVVGLWTGHRRLRGRMEELHGRVVSLRGDVGTLPDRMAELTGHVEALDGQVSEMAEAPLIARALVHPRRVALVLNPIKAEADTVRERVAAAVREAGLPELEVYETTVEDPGQQMTRDAVAGGADVVIAAGGDGTVRFVAEELAGTETSLGVVPLGTGNLLARNLRFPLEDLDACINTALHGTARQIDSIDIKVETTDGTTVRNTFLVIAGAGVDAEVMGDTRDDLKVKAGWLAYGEAGMRHLPGSRKEISVSLDGGAPRRRKVRSVMVANCGELTAGMDFVPEARFDDGLLDVVMLSPRHVGDWIRIAAKTLTKSRHEIPVMETHQATRCRVVLHEPMAAQLDGDPIGEVRSIDARVRPDSLRILVPAADVPDSAAAPAMKPEAVPEEHA
ncbi:diacylglycerol kinase family protein [Citricoccus sp. SGAir0253]|uniref:diacylglycerol/lipid kinase family protein n=1 Tax=Citricoccus sp. SGAir0253 TaxID=2567881 RepID=UPI001FEFF90A|nr:diacylglycerol kinase family protein [Citricoccus sp. SGAir0253]